MNFNIRTSNYDLEELLDKLHINNYAVITKNELSNCNADNIIINLNGNSTVSI